LVSTKATTTNGGCASHSASALTAACVAVRALFSDCPRHAGDWIVDQLSSKGTGRSHCSSTPRKETPSRLFPSGPENPLQNLYFSLICTSEKWNVRPNLIKFAGHQNLYFGQFKILYPLFCAAYGGLLVPVVLLAKAGCNSVQITNSHYVSRLRPSRASTRTRTGEGVSQTQLRRIHELGWSGWCCAGPETGAPVSDW
jgi:hypothetical protein